MLTISTSVLAPFGWALSLGLLLLLALWIDKRWGEPPVALHPVVWMGNYLALCGCVSVRLQAAPAFALGALAWCIGAVVIGVLTWGLQSVFLWGVTGLLQPLGFGRFGYLDALWLLLLFCLLGWSLKSMLSWRMLRDETAAVEVALQGSLQAGRDRLAMLVSRDTANLSESEVRESAIESLAENLNDSVVAPIFWFVLFGLPGAAVYRFANTADAMWGYKGLRNGVNWEWAGKWAAWADDMLSWLPARITALLLALISGGFRLKILRGEARKTPSPNSGWPMAAMALALGVRLQKPGVYVLNASGRPPKPVDAALAQKKASKVVLAAFLSAQSAIIFIAFLKS
jgi:adenosylcobinamide-phosphate synthase